jgi:hypothetical protein
MELSGLLKLESFCTLIPSNIRASPSITPSLLSLAKSCLLLNLQTILNGINHTFPRYGEFSKTPPNAIFPPIPSCSSSYVPHHNIKSCPPHPTYAIGLLLSSSGILIYASIAALNTAKPAHPTTTACGPAFLAKIPPVIHPPATPLYKSFFARRPSIAHSVPLKIAPTLAKFFPEDLDD